MTLSSPSDASRQRRYGIVLSYAHKGLAMLVSLGYTPLMLRLLGQNEYGVYQAAESVISYLNLLTFGCGAAYVRFHARFQTKGDEEGLATLNGLYLLIFSAAGVLALLISFVFAIYAGAILGDKLTDAEVHTASQLLVLMGVNTLVVFLNNVFSTYLMARERFVWQSVLGIFTTCVQPACILPLLLLGKGSVGMASAALGVHIVTLFLNVWQARQQEMKVRWTHIPRTLVREVTAFSSILFLTSIAGAINSTIDKLLLTRMVGPAPVAVYDIGNKFNLYLMSMVVPIFGAFIPKVNQMVAQGASNRDLTDLMLRVGRIQFFIVAYFLGGFLLLGRFFIAIYAGNGYEHSYMVAILLIGASVVPYCQSLGVEIQKAQNRHLFRAVSFLSIAIVNCLISIPLIWRFGVIGAAIGSAFTLLAGNTISMNLYYQLCMRLEMKRFWKGLAMPCISFLIALTLAALPTWRWPIDSFPRFIAIFCLFSISYMALMYCIATSPQEKQLLRDLLLRLHLFSGPNA